MIPPAKQLRVALISYEFGEYSVQLANALAERAEVLLLLPNQTVEPHLEKLTNAVHLFSFPTPRLRQAVRQLKSIRQLIEEIHRFRPDVVHYQGAHLWFDLAFPFLRRCALVMTIHDFKPHPGDQLSLKTPVWAEMRARRHAHGLIVHTAYTRELVIRQFPEAAEDISVIPHVQIGSGVSSLSIPEDESLVLFFGRIWEYKGLEYLIRAEPLITARVPNAKILIAGKGEDFSRYRQMMVHPDRFIVRNEFIAEDRAAFYFRRASVVVLPYLEASQSGVIPMAYSAAKPVVATNVGGLPEMVEEGRTGYLVAPGDAEQLAAAVTRILLNAPLRHQLGANGKRKIETECSASVTAHKTMDAYRRAIERANQGLRNAAVAAAF